MKITIRTYLLGALFMCVGTSQADCCPESIDEREAKWKAELLQNIPELGRPEHDPILTFFCRRDALCRNPHPPFEEKKKAKREFCKHINANNRALLKKLPRIMYDLLTAHQAHNNRLLRREHESLENFDNYWHLLKDTFVSYRDIITEIDSQPIQSFYGPDQDLENFCKLLDTYLQTCRDYADWRAAIEMRQLPFFQKLGWACLFWLPVSYSSQFQRIVRKTH